MVDLVDKLSEVTEENGEILRQKLKMYLKLASADETKFKTLARTLTLTSSHSTFSRYLNKTGTDSPKTLHASDHRKLVKYLFERGYWSERGPILDKLAEIPHPFYHALNQFLCIGTSTIENMTAQVPGLYKVWRPSTHRPGFFVRGMAQIEYQPESVSLSVCETQIFKGEDHSRSRQEIFDGYMTKRSNKYCIVSCDDAKTALRVTMLHRIQYESDETTVVGMCGAVMGMYENDLYAAPIYFERFDGQLDKLKEALDIIPEKDVPDSILDRLRRFQDHERVRDLVIF